VTYKTVFEAVDITDSFLTWGPVFGLVGVAVGTLFVLKPQLTQYWFLPGVSSRRRALSSWIWLIFAIAWTVQALVATRRDQVPAVSPSHEQHVVAGPITHFVRMPYNGPSHGSFSVAGRSFSYSDAMMNAALANSPLRDGLHARVTYRERVIKGVEILRVEVADPN
jgi:hypothetical protein